MKLPLQTLTLLLLLGASWVSSKFTFPLRISSAEIKNTQPVETATPKDIVGLALASDPTGKINFLAMVDNLEGDAGRGYYLELSVGTPPQQLNILVDTGSSNFAVAGAPNPYIKAFFNSTMSTSYKTEDIEVTVRYTQGSWTGLLGQDVVTVPKGLNGTFIVNIVSIFESESFFLPNINWQGILGLAYRSLAKRSRCSRTICYHLFRYPHYQQHHCLRPNYYNCCSATGSMGILAGCIVNLYAIGVRPTRSSHHHTSRSH